MNHLFKRTVDEINGYYMKYEYSKAHSLAISLIAKQAQSGTLELEEIAELFRHEQGTFTNYEKCKRKADKMKSNFLDCIEVLVKFYRNNPYSLTYDIAKTWIYQLMSISDVSPSQAEVLVIINEALYEDLVERI